MAAALANVAARIGLESGGVSLPLVGEGGAHFSVRPGEGRAPERGGGGWLAHGDADALAPLLERVASEWPHVNAPQTGGVGAALDWLRRALIGDGPNRPCRVKRSGNCNGPRAGKSTRYWTPGAVTCCPAVSRRCGTDHRLRQRATRGAQAPG